MLSIAYTVSPLIIRYLTRIEENRKRILLQPLAQTDELTMQFETTLARIHYGLLLVDQKLHSGTIKTILSNQIVLAMQKNPQKLAPIQNTILRYKQSLDYIKRDWLLSTEPITLKTLLNLYEISAKEALPVHQNQLQAILTYLDASVENPFVKAGIAKLLFRNLLPIEEKNEIFSTLCSYLFLYKAGMDCRGFINLEKPWAQDKRIFLGQYKTTISKSNITSWLEYSIKLIAIQLETTLPQMHQTTIEVGQKDIGQLNERQKTILTLLEDPQAVITNRTVQKIFHISQITASRDLAKLTMLGLLYTHGKGRSVRYTRN